LHTVSSHFARSSWPKPKIACIGSPSTEVGKAFEAKPTSACCLTEQSWYSSTISRAKLAETNVVDMTRLQ
jgi:hypothetical protein